MIEFQGEISKKTRRFIKKRESRFNMIGMTFACIVVGLPVVAAMAAWQLWTLFLTIPCGVIFLILAYTSTDITVFVPQRVVITHDGTIKSECRKTSDERHISEVEKVTDRGEFYHISFESSFGDGRFVCQKNLLVSGTPEEFEKMFEGKIRKIK